ncbi:MAG: hypothetical protein ABJM06_04925 [Gilvibacter sp.]
MKYLVVIICLFSMFSCTQEEAVKVESIESLNFEAKAVFDEKSEGVYKGTFTTNDSQKRGVIAIQVMADKSAYAKMVYSNGSDLILKATGDMQLSDQEILYTFSEGQVELSFQVSLNGKNPKVSGLLIANTPSFATILKETSRGAVLPVTGTYVCTECGTHPLFNGGITQTFSATTVSGAGNNNQDIVTQILFNGNDFGSATGNTQAGCVNSGSARVCDISGASTAIAGRVINWTGTHSFLRGSTDCSEVEGTWTYDSVYGMLSGTFTSDSSCGI